jgi:glycosyltransferase involved in cell wall biosynthesis
MTDDSPNISVIVPVHNGAGFYASALNSIERQNWPRLQVIVVDDGSSDALHEEIEKHGYPVAVLRQDRKGPAAARNLGIRRASADCIAFLDVDDLWTDGHLNRLYTALQRNPEAAFAQGLMRQFVHLPDGQYKFSGAYRMPYLGACLFKRQALEEVNLLDEGMPMGEDYDLMVRFWEKKKTRVVIDKVSLHYRRHAGNMTRGKNHQANLAVLQRRATRVRSGETDPNIENDLDFAVYMGDIRGFTEGELTVEDPWAS